MTFSNDVERAISTARLSTYRADARDDEHAWALYRWNLDLVAAFLPLISDAEVALRNAMHTQLSNVFGREDWWAAEGLVLDDATSETLTVVVKRHQKKISKGSVTPGKVVAELMLGTWVMLLSRGGTSSLGKPIDYETKLWRPALRLCFATGTKTATGRIRRPTREEVHLKASNLQVLRNRAAHHEPIFNGVRMAGGQKRIGVLGLWDDSVRILEWISPALAAEHADKRLVPNLFAARP